MTAPPSGGRQSASPLTPLCWPMCCSAIPRKFCRGVFPPAHTHTHTSDNTVAQQHNLEGNMFVLWLWCCLSVFSWISEQLKSSKAAKSSTFSRCVNVVATHYCSSHPVGSRLLVVVQCVIHWKLKLKKQRLSKDKMRRTVSRYLRIFRLIMSVIIRSLLTFT